MKSLFCYLSILCFVHVLFAPFADGFQDVANEAKPENGKVEKNVASINVAGLRHHPGFFDFYLDDDDGKVWLRIDGKFKQPFLYVTSLASGLGSNPVGLDRGQLGATRVVRFLQVGTRVYLEQVNMKFRALSNNRSEANAVSDSFANSVLWSGKLEKSTDNKLLVDITSLIVRDAHQASQKLDSTGQGKFTFAADRSFPLFSEMRSFVENCEFEAAVTLNSSQPGALARRTAATGNSITLRQHHSFIKLPDNEYQPRVYDPRCGSFHISFQDYSVPITDNIEKRFVTRHRLKKKNPRAPRSEAVEPIVYYLDPGVPSPVKEALLEGAAWWNEAFEAAGYIDAFQIKVLPDDADPMDVRFNVIQWVHRATRGWSYGQSIVDPRTGEIIKGHVLLGSLRVRQDLTLMNGLRGLGNDERVRGPNGFCSSCQGMDLSPIPLSRLTSQDAGVEVALARIRQLSAHEVGHTLGFAHNFAASTYGDRASVMDYPAPRTRIVNGKIDLKDAYGVGVGVWDHFLVKYAYSEFETAADEKSALEKLIAEAIRKKHLYISDADARPAGAAHPLASLWDNGTDPVESLSHEIKVRRIALARFGMNLIEKGVPMSELEKSFVPIYLHHRYQVAATAKMIGGVNYSYAVAGDGQVVRESVPADRQKNALEVLLKTLDPEFLQIPGRITELIPPSPFDSPSDRERFTSKTGKLFDEETAVEVAADLTISQLLHPQRLARVAGLRRKDWTVKSILNSLNHHLFHAKDDDGEQLQSIRRVVQNVYVDRLIQLSGDQAASVDVHSWSNNALRELRTELVKQIEGPTLRTFHKMLVAKIDRQLDRPGPDQLPRKISEIPPGSPIGNR